MAVPVAKRLFDVNEYRRLAQAGILSEDDRVELINGEVVEMSPIGSAHATCVRGLDELLHEKLGRSVFVSAQNPIELDDRSEPQPDLAVLKRRPDRYAHAHPKPEDVLLVIEVADSSIDYDRLIKARLYARSGIPETWIVDLNTSLVTVFNAPSNGEYRSSREFKPGELVTSLSVPALTLGVADILG